MTRIFFFLLYSFSSVSLFASGTSISGRVTDENGQPLEFAVVTLLQPNDSSLVKGAMTGVNGEFTLENLPAGKFLLVSSMTGFVREERLLEELHDGEQRQISDIVMRASKEMETVTIRSTQPLFVQKPGMLIMNVESSPVRLSGTAYDLLKKAPGVSVDQDDNISLKGKSGVRIYIDGKNTYLQGTQLATYLQSIPAQEVIRIEIITNPPAKYDAEGDAGIINIITRKGTQQGLNGSVYAGAQQGNRFGSNSGISFNYGKPKYNVYGRYDFSAPQRLDYHASEKSALFNGDQVFFTQQSSFNYRPLTHSARFGIDFTPDAATSWGFRCEGLYDAERISTSNSTLLHDAVETPLADYSQDSRLHGNFSNAGTGVYYNRTLDTNGRSFSANADYLGYFDHTNESYDLRVNDYPSASQDQLLQRSRSENTIHIAVAQADYTQPLGKNLRLETGIKSSYVETKNELHFETLVNSSWTNDSTRSNSFSYSELIGAAYVNLSGKTRKWDYQAGLRAEYTASNGTSPTLQRSQENSYSRLFPSFFASRKIGEKQEINLAVSRRINRPDYGMLNPFLFYIDPFTYQAGNPFLQAEMAWTGSAGYAWNNQLFVSADYSRKNNGMTRVFYQPDTNGILYMTTLNMSTVENAHLEISASCNLFKWWISEGSVAAIYSRYRSEISGEGIDNQSLNFRADLTETFLLAGGWKLQVSGWYQTRRYYGVMLFAPNGSADAGISRSFFENSLQLSLTASDIFHTQLMKNTISMSNSSMSITHTPDTRSISVRLRYNFGNTKAARKSQFKSGADELKQRAG